MLNQGLKLKTYAYDGKYFTQLIQVKFRLKEAIDDLR